MADPKNRVVSTFLVVNSRGEVRTRQTARSLQWDEIAFKVVVTIPVGWGRVAEQVIELQMPAPPDPEVLGTPTVIRPEPPSEEAVNG